MRYIAVKYNVAEHWFPRTDVQKAAKIDEFLNWQHLNIRQWCLEIFVNTVSMHGAPIQPIAIYSYEHAQAFEKNRDIVLLPHHTLVGNIYCLLRHCSSSL